MENERSMAAKKEETQQACAACKHQRKKCKKETCVLAPFFPASKTKEFEAVHKVYGVCNLQRMIQAVDTREERFILVDSLIWEAIVDCVTLYMVVRLIIRGYRLRKISYSF